MITINIYYKGINGNAKKFVKEMIESKLVEKIKNEKVILDMIIFFQLVRNEI